MTRDEEFVQKLLSLNISSRYLKDLSEDKFNFRLKKSDSSWQTNLTMVEAILLWWENGIREEVIGRKCPGIEI